MIEIYGKEPVSIVNETGIYGFFGEYRWLSNFHLVKISYNGRIFNSSEAAYMSEKSTDEFYKDMLSIIKSPKEAKSFGRRVALREDWEDIKIKVMTDVLLLKYSNPLLKQKLLDTGNLYLEESNWWNDQFWGVCDGVGLNQLGVLTMNVRDYYRK